MTWDGCREGDLRCGDGLAHGDLERTGDDDVVLDSPMGRIAVAFAPRNEYGVLVHDVTLPRGDVVNNPVRVLTHPTERGRRVGNLLSLSTPLGVLLASAGRARLRRGPHGLLLAEGCRLPLFAAGAMTVGDVVLTRGRFADLVQRLPRVLEHESVHAGQWLRWGGLPFLPAYLLGGAWSLLRTGDRAIGNPFEVAAGLEAGGYRGSPLPRRK